MPTLQHVRFQMASFKQSPWPQIWTSKTVMIGKHSAYLQRAGNLCNHVGREKEVRDAGTEGGEKSSQSARIASNLGIELFLGKNLEDLKLLWFSAQFGIFL